MLSLSDFQPIILQSTPDQQARNYKEVAAGYCLINMQATYRSKHVAESPTQKPCRHPWESREQASQVNYGS